jgi:hypothetical protein
MRLLIDPHHQGFGDGEGAGAEHGVAAAQPFIFRIWSTSAAIASASAGNIRRAMANQSFRILAASSHAAAVPVRITGMSASSASDALARAMRPPTMTHSPFCRLGSDNLASFSRLRHLPHFQVRRFYLRVHQKQGLVLL